MDNGSSFLIFIRHFIIIVKKFCLDEVWSLKVAIDYWNPLLLNCKPTFYQKEKKNTANQPSTAEVETNCVQLEKQIPSYFYYVRF